MQISSVKNTSQGSATSFYLQFYTNFTQIKFNFYIHGSNSVALVRAM